MNFTDKFLKSLDACKEHHITTFSHIATLAILNKSEKGVYMSNLARLLKIKSAAVTTIADKLAGMGLVKRTPDEKDRRAFRLQITAAGRDALDIILPNK